MIDLLKCVVTTIQPPTASMQRWSEVIGALDSEVIVIGDRKGPASFSLPNCRFFAVNAPEYAEFGLSLNLPVGHYARKNLGYLLAIRAGATRIYETDDDNAPLSHWAPRNLETELQSVAEAPWCNVYKYFTRERIWPRGLPLDQVVKSFHSTVPAGPLTRHTCPIQQGLADGSPDVDAVWRLVFDHSVNFDRRAGLVLKPGTWCPFNSQSTWWWRRAFALLYLPSYCSFRMTDIWRSFVAQRCLWEEGLGVGFHASEVVQDRNVHALMRDFRDEIVGYERNAELALKLEATKLSRGDLTGNLCRCYESLMDIGAFGKDEAVLVRAWASDIEKLLTSA